MADGESPTSAEFGVRHRLLMARRAAVAYATACDHDMDRWGADGTCTCSRCGWIMDDVDAEAFLATGDSGELGPLSRTCMPEVYDAC